MKNKILFLLIALLGLTAYSQTYIVPQGRNGQVNEVKGGNAFKDFLKVPVKLNNENQFKDVDSTGRLQFNKTTKLLQYHNGTKWVDNDAMKADLQNGKILISQIPDALVGAVNYQSTYNAATSLPTLPPATGNKGKYWVVSAAGTFNGKSVKDGDWIISNGSIYETLERQAVQSVSGKTGVIILNINDIVGLPDALALKANDVDVLKTTTNQTKTGTLTVNGYLKAISNGASAFEVQTGALDNVLSFSGRTIQGYNSAGNTPKAIFLQPDGGNLGVNNSNPQSTLDVNGVIRSNGGGMYVYKDYTDTIPTQLVLSSQSTPDKSLYLGLNTTTNHGQIQALWQGVDVMPLELNPAGGNVGIKNNNPQQALDVNGNIYASGKMISQNAPVDLIDVARLKELNDKVNWTDAEARYAKVIGDELYKGNKAFESSPTVPTAINAGHAINLAQLQAAIANLKPQDYINTASTLNILSFITSAQMYITHTGAASTWTAPPITGTTSQNLYLLNVGTVDITLNSASGGSDFYMSSNYSAITIFRNSILVMHNNGIKWICYRVFFQT